MNSLLYEDADIMFLKSKKMTSTSGIYSKMWEKKFALGKMFSFHETAQEMMLQYVISAFSPTYFRIVNINFIDVFPEFQGIQII